MAHIITITAHDVAKLAALEAEHSPHAWSAAHFQAAATSSSDTIWVLEQQGQWLAWAVWQQVLDEMELHLITTASEYRQQGFASQLLTALTQAACTLNVRRILLEVRASNVAAQQLYRKHGFAHIATRKRYYDGTEDAWIMEKLC